MNAILVLSTVDSEELARGIASALIEAGEAACVNIVAGVRSIYRWEGEICDEWEQLLLIKTTRDRFDEVRARIRLLHTYQIPEVIACPIDSADTDYLSWLRAQVHNPERD